MMAIGIQMAGPTSTRELRGGHVRLSRKLGPAGSWGFGPSDYTTADDVREIYWDPTRCPTTTSKQGAFVDTEPRQALRQGRSAVELPAVTLRTPARARPIARPAVAGAARCRNSTDARCDRGSSSPAIGARS